MPPRSAGIRDGEDKIVWRKGVRKDGYIRLETDFGTRMAGKQYCVYCLLHRQKSSNGD